jgi:hypothetical protein
MQPTDACSLYEYRFNVVPFGNPHMQSQFADDLKTALRIRDWMLLNSPYPWITVKVYDTVDGVFY